jgi:hypothetical protein
MGLNSFGRLVENRQLRFKNEGAADRELLLFPVANDGWMVGRSMTEVSGSGKDDFISRIFANLGYYASSGANTFGDSGDIYRRGTPFPTKRAIRLYCPAVTTKVGGAAVSALLKLPAASPASMPWCARSSSHRVQRYRAAVRLFRKGLGLLWRKNDQAAISSSAPARIGPRDIRSARCPVENASGSVR